MPNLLFAMPRTNDPEELLEAALMWKALKDEFGAAIHPLLPDDAVVAGDVVFGLPTKPQEMILTSPSSGNYWDMPAFTSRLSRSFKVCTLPDAELEVARLGAEGKGAFLKSLRPKYFTGGGEPGQSAGKILGAMVYSFCDEPKPCLMVQERVSMTHEMRFVVVNGAIVAESPVLHRATPASAMSAELRGVDLAEILYRGPGAELDEFEVRPAARSNMRDMAAAIARESCLASGTVDIALLDGDDSRIEPIEINFGNPGRYGLYLCDPVAIAKASRALVPESILEQSAPKRRGSIKAMMAAHIAPSARDVVWDDGLDF